MSEPVREPRPQSLWRLLLSHQREANLDRCLGIPLGRRPLHLCSRCLALYPLVVLMVLVESGGLWWTGQSRWLLAIGLIVPAVVDWGRTQLFGDRGSNPVRLVTGSLAGIGLGLSFSVYLRHPTSVWFWSLMGGLALVIVLVWLTRAGPVE